MKRPERVLYIFTKANPTSWLFWGSVALAGYSAVAGGWLASGVAEGRSVSFRQPGDEVGPPWAGLLAGPAGGLAAGYTGFLFGQAEGRDLWQSPHLLWQLLAQAAVAGSGALLAAAALVDPGRPARRLLARMFVASSAANLGLLAAEYGRRQPTRQAEAAARMVTRGRYSKLFRWGAVGMGALGARRGIPALGGRRRWWAAAGGVVGQTGLARLRVGRSSGPDRTSRCRELCRRR